MYSHLAFFSWHGYIIFGSQERSITIWWGNAMKRFLLVIVTVAFMVTSASMAGAWEVRIENSCNKDVTIRVEGSHLFWNQVDCEMTVAAHTTASCQLPWAICPVRIYGDYVVNRSTYDLIPVYCGWLNFPVPCCWNVNVEVRHRDYWRGDSCTLERH